MTVAEMIEALSAYPPELAHRVREVLRDRHATCDDGCPLRQVWAEDIQEILDAANELTADERSTT